MMETQRTNAIPLGSLLDCVCRLLDGEAEFIASAHIDHARATLKNQAALVSLTDLLEHK